MTSQYPWLPAPDSLTLLQNEVHVWRAVLKSDPIELERLRVTLTADERARAARFQFSKDQQHFVAARGILRMILARYLDRTPDQFEFCCNQFGKPELVPSGYTGGLRFNLSHSQGLALYALVRDHEIGVDLEGVRADFEWEDIANRSFSPAEVDALQLVPAALRAEAFFNCWTRKEAFVKARGEGLSLPLDQFEVSVAPGKPARLLRTAGDLQEASQWSFRELDPAPGYKAAIAVRSPISHFKLWELCSFRAPTVS